VEAGVKSVVLVHIGRPTIRAIDAGEIEDLEFARDGQVFEFQVAGVLPQPDTRGR
jgi:hypothetical protein